MEEIVANQNSQAYADGREAWSRKDVKNKDALCPYPIGSGSNRMNWFAGLLDARFDEKYNRRSNNRLNL